MLLKTMIVEILKEGKPVSAGGVARRCGEDKVRVRDHLVKLHEDGLCRVRSCKLTGAVLFVPNIVNLINLPTDPR